jgi:hypothetical protein
MAPTVFGYFAFWREIGEEYEPHDVATSTASEAGVPWIVPEAPPPRMAFSRVIRALLRDARERQMDFRKEKAGDKEAEYAVLAKVAGSAALAPVGAICWTEKDGLTFQGLEPDDAVRVEAQKIYSESCGVLTREDWTVKLRVTMLSRWSALPARAGGVVYWVPSEPEVQAEMNAVNNVIASVASLELVVAPCLDADLVSSIIEDGLVAAREVLDKRSMGPDKQALWLDEELKRFTRALAIVPVTSMQTDAGVAVDGHMKKLHELRGMLPAEPVVAPPGAGRKPPTPGKRGKKKAAKEAAPTPATPAVEAEPPALMHAATGEMVPVAPAPPPVPAPSGMMDFSQLSAVMAPQVRREITLKGGGQPPEVNIVLLPTEAVLVPGVLPGLPTEAPPLALPVTLPEPAAAPPVLRVAAVDGREIELAVPSRALGGEMHEYAIVNAAEEVLVDLEWPWCPSPVANVDWCAFGGSVYTARGVLQ